MELGKSETEICLIAGQETFSKLGFFPEGVFGFKGNV